MPSNVRYELAEWTQAISAGGIGAIHQLVKQRGSDHALTRRLGVFKLYNPYTESDHESPSQCHTSQPKRYPGHGVPALAVRTPARGSDRPNLTSACAGFGTSECPPNHR